MTTTTGANLLQAILDNPEDDAVRLIYADWLEENGQDERAEFIRVQIELASIASQQEEFSKADISHFDGERAAVCERQAKLWKREIRLYNRGEKGGFINWYVWSNLPNAIACKHDSFVMRRGFVDEVCCPAADWIRHGHQILAAHPVTTVRLMTWPEVVEQCDRTTSYYWLASLKGTSRTTVASLPETNRVITRRLLREEWPRVRNWELPQ